MRTGFLSLLTAGLLLVTALPAQSAPQLQQQRQLYTQIKTDLEAGKTDSFLANRQTLSSYPLLPYLTYDELTLRLRNASNDEVIAFIDQHPDLPQLRWLKLRWLRLLAERGNWPLFLQHYQPELEFAELDCLHAGYLLEQGQRQESWDATRNIWLSGQSRPNACDPQFERWQAAGQRTPELIWQRMELALDSRNPALARYLAKEHSNSAKANLLVEVAAKPELLKQTERFSADTVENRSIVAQGLRRLIRSNSDETLRLLEHYQKHLRFTETQQRQLARDVGSLLAKRFDARALRVFQQLDPDLAEPLAAEWHARLLLRLERWSEAAKLISRMPESLLDTPRWQYWQARSAQLAKSSSLPYKEHYEVLATDRDYYGYLAADHIRRPYQLNHVPAPVSEQTLQQVKASPLVRRAIELKAMDDWRGALHEWLHGVKVFGHEQQLAQAKVGLELQWYNPAIRSLAQARYWDDLDVRFPLAYRTELVKAAEARKLPASWVYAITRQESAFTPGIHSHAGAMGLMQVMPATAKETARRYDIPYTGPSDALKPAINVQLGTAYLDHVMQQFSGNRILSSAAYNAGPGRVRQWLKDAKHLPFDVWIETIPFDETRQYVQNVLMYSVIYSQKLDAPEPLVQWHERQLDGRRE